ncbi:MAG: glycosyltransferase [Pseudomonadota bacterium]
MKPHLIFYCQHSLGMGHLVRSLALCDALASSFDVTLLNGGRWPGSFARPSTVEIVDLSPIGMAEDASIVSLDGLPIHEAKARRLASIQETVAARPADVVVIELYPLGRKKFRFEIEPLIDLSAGAVIACSVRDILVNNRHDQQRHDDRAAEALNDKFDCVIVHADPSFASLEESFRPTAPLRIPVFYSGFVAPELARGAVGPRSGVIVSAGGGIVGGPLFNAALTAAPRIERETGHNTTIVAGPFLPADEWRELEERAKSTPQATLIRETPDLYAMLCGASVSVSQCGYNSALEIVRSGVAALVVPFVRERETEQLERAGRLAKIGAVETLHPDDATPDRLAEIVRQLSAGGRINTARPLALNGGDTTRRILLEAYSRRRARPCERRAV